MPGTDRLMVIFSLGGWTLERHLRGHSVRCCTALVPTGAGAGEDDAEIVLDPFPARGSRGTVDGGQARLWRDGVEVPDPGPGGLRWTDHELLVFVAATLRDWLVLPLQVTGTGRVETERGALWVSEAGRVQRHEAVSGEVHEYRSYCDFGGIEFATRRRTLSERGLPVLWADLVAAHLLPSPTPSPMPSPMPSPPEEPDAARREALN